MGNVPSNAQNGCMKDHRERSFYLTFVMWLFVTAEEKKREWGGKSAPGRSTKEKKVLKGDFFFLSVNSFAQLS